MQRFRQCLLPALCGLLLTAATSSSVEASPKQEPKIGEPTCGEYGTTVNFEADASAAARKALKEEKLVMVLHISGHFEDPDFT